MSRNRTWTIIVPGLCLSALCSNLHAKTAPQHRLAHVMGTVESVGGGGYKIHDPAGKAVRVVIATGGHLYRLLPSNTSAIHRGWFAHAIGSPMRQTIRTEMLVLFPPESAAGVPPASAGMSGVGRILRGGKAPILQTVGGKIQVILSPNARIVVATGVKLADLKKGDIAMAFGRQIGPRFLASIVHIPPRMSGMTRDNRSGTRMMAPMGGSSKRK